jgi:hypothetical protein
MGLRGPWMVDVDADKGIIGGTWADRIFGWVGDFEGCTMDLGEILGNCGEGLYDGRSSVSGMGLMWKRTPSTSAYLVHQC